MTDPNNNNNDNNNATVFVEFSDSGVHSDVEPGGTAGGGGDPDPSSSARGGGDASVMSDKTNHDDYPNGNGPPPNKKKEEVEIARNETRCVLYLRVLTFALLAVTTIAVAIAVHRMMRKAEHHRLHESFNDNAGKILEAVGTIMDNTLTAVDFFAVTLTSYAHNNQQVTGANQSWPFVTLPDMAVRSSKLRSLSKIFLFSIYHYIEHEKRAAWEAYTAANKGWIDEGIETQKADPTFRGILNEDWYSSDQINFYGKRAADADFYIVRWQASPVLVSVLCCFVVSYVCRCHAVLIFCWLLCTHYYHRRF
jgi:hypothetical protein